MGWNAWFIEPGGLMSVLRAQQRRLATEHTIFSAIFQSFFFFFFCNGEKATEILRIVCASILTPFSNPHTLAFFFFFWRWRNMSSRTARFPFVFFRFFTNRLMALDRTHICDFARLFSLLVLVFLCFGMIYSYTIVTMSVSFANYLFYAGMYKALGTIRVVAPGKACLRTNTLP